MDARESCGLTGAAVKPLADVLEKEWQTQLIGTRGNPGLARMLGWRCYHVLRSKGSEPGYPDWTLVRDRVIFVELKKQDGQLSAAQREWIDALRDAGAEVHVWRPADLEEAAAILTRRDRSRAAVA